MTTTTASSSKGPPSDDSSSGNYLQQDEDDSFTFRSRKSYPQRNNRSKLNYRDLERGVYDAHELRQSMWALGGPTFLNANDRAGKRNNNAEYSEDEDEEETDEMLVEQKDKSTDDTDRMHRRLWCICKEPWDHSRLMLRCDSCANWYHGDCIGMTKEQARILEVNNDQFVCPPCQGVKPGRVSDPSMLIKRKRLEASSPDNRKTGERTNDMVSSKNLTQSEPSKRPKTGVFFHRDSPAGPQIHCIVHGCTNWARSGWVYCSPACIRRHINDTLQTIQRSKGENNDNPPSREDILLYENRTKKVLDRKLVPKVEDLCTWINQHPSYEIVKPALRQSILLTANESKSPSSPVGLIRQSSITSPKSPLTPTSIKPKLSWTSTASNTKPIPIKKAPVQLAKQTSNTPSSPTIQNYADIRVKVPQALYDKLTARLDKSGDTTIPKEDIRVLVDKIEEEMYRVYGKVDNAYKNKFRSLLSNISNTNNSFFYKHVLSKETTAKQIVAMKPEDMLPPEEKEKRKDEFEKEVQKIMKAEEQTAEEMARRAKTKTTRQGLVDNDAVFPAYKPTNKPSTEQQESKPTTVPKTKSHPTSKPTQKTKKPITPTTGQKPKPKVQTIVSNKDTSASQDQHTVDANPTTSTPTPSEPLIAPKTEPVPIKPPEESPTPSSKSPPPEESNTTFAPVDLDNDYIEPESPTGIDALLYDDDDEMNNTGSHSRASANQQKHPESPGDTNEYLPPPTQPIRTDYNPLAASKPKTDTPTLYQPTPIARSSIQWRGVILPPDTKLPCQSLRVYGESDYLIGDIPEQLGILGRLRLGDLWEYIRESIAVRDVIILSLVSSNTADQNAFIRYVETMRTSGRAAVITKRSEPSAIRDMYVLAADIKECPANVISTLTLPANIDPKQLFLVVIGSGKRTSKSFGRPNENQSSTNLTYKPVSLQDAATMRDPRLLRNKDPRLGGSTTSETPTNDTPTSSVTQPMSTKSMSNKYSTDDLLKVISESFDRIRQSTSTEAIHGIIMSTIELLKSNDREDLCVKFTTDLPKVMTTDIKSVKEPSVGLTDDNLNEENMEVDEEQDKRQLAVSEYNDVDYRFLDQDTDHREDADDRAMKSTSIDEKRGLSIANDSDFRINDAKNVSPR